MRTRSCVFLALLFGACHSLLAGVLYSVTDLGALRLNETVDGAGINNLGQVVGYEYPTGGPAALSHAFLYLDGQMTDLGPGNAWDINNTGQITGEFATATGYHHAFLYSNGQRTDLGAYGGNTSVGFAINDLGQVTGTVNPSSIGSHAFLYSDGQTSIPGTLVEGRGINDAGEIAGYTNKGPAIYSHGQTIDLGTSGGVAFAINNAGQVTGYIRSGATGQHAFLDSNGQMQDLGTLPGASDANAYAINNSGQVVGISSEVVGIPGTLSGAHAFLYSNGQMLDLNDLIDPALGMTLYNAVGINDRGQIVANGVDHSGSHAFLLTPTPEPSTVALLGVPLLTLLVWSRRPPVPTVDTNLKTEVRAER